LHPVSPSIEFELNSTKPKFQWFLNSIRCILI
jgi:hypothetical protein